MAEPISIIRDIIIKEMDLQPDRIWIYNADAPLPKDSGLFCILSLNAQNPFSNNVKYECNFEDDTLNEVQTMNIQADITVSLLSKDDSARSRAYEVQMALGSTYSQQMQEKNRMHISRIGNVIDASFLEATSRLNRFDVDCVALYAYKKVNPVDYYDKFPIDSMLRPEIKIEP